MRVELSVYKMAQLPNKVRNILFLNSTYLSRLRGRAGTNSKDYVPQYDHNREMWEISEPTLHQIPRFATPYIPKDSQKTTPRKYSLIFKTLYLKVWTVLTVFNFSVSPLYPCTLINSMLFLNTKDITSHSKVIKYFLPLGLTACPQASPGGLWGPRGGLPRPAPTCPCLFEPIYLFPK